MLFDPGQMHEYVLGAGSEGEVPAESLGSNNYMVPWTVL